MVNLDPMRLVMMLKQGNPKMVATQIIQNNFPNDPSMNNLLSLGEKGDVQSLQQIAQQVLGAQGKDLNTELQSLFKDINAL
jgi:hypothetical protein